MSKDLIWLRSQGEQCAECGIQPQKRIALLLRDGRRYGHFCSQECSESWYRVEKMSKEAK